MKKLILFIALTIFTVGMYAQEKSKIEPNKMEQTKVEKYQCPKCDFFDTKAGKCPTHQFDLVKEGTYCCSMCNMTCELACTCPKCGIEMKKMECKKAVPDTKTKVVEPKK